MFNVKRCLIVFITPCEVRIERINSNKVPNIKKCKMELERIDRNSMGESNENRDKSKNSENKLITDTQYRRKGRKVQPSQKYGSE